MATMPERIKELETTQRLQEEEHEKMMANLSVRIENAHTLATEAKNMAMQTDSKIEQMPAKIVEQIRKENKSKRFELRDWAFLVLAIGTLIATYWKH